MYDSVTEGTFPVLRSVVLDAADARGLAEFYRQLLGLEYREGDEPPPDGSDDSASRNWLVLRHPSGWPRIAFQRVERLPRSSWPETDVPQQLHLDFSVPDVAVLTAQHERALGLGAKLLLDRFGDPIEPLYVYGDPEGHPFCIFVVPPHLS
jgi:catechol 2,3-dioxygenase-like lactoylglutathione lyase family enzyme